MPKINRKKTMPAFHHPERQSGVVMVIALIVLVAMTLGGIALIRSVYSTNLIAGNLAFRKSALTSGDAGVEGAFKWLQAPPTSCADLTVSCPAEGYAASRGTERAANQTLDDFWKQITQTMTVRQVSDPVNNHIYYIIQRLCLSEGATQVASCSTNPTTSSTDNSSKSDLDPLTDLSKVYYRVTTRIEGQRQTVVYTQAIITM